MAQYDDAPSYSFDLPVDRGPSLLSGTPAVLTSAFDFLSTLPSVFAQAANEVLEEHVSESRERLERDDDYQSIAKYYDVVQVEDGEGEGIGMQVEPLSSGRKGREKIVLEKAIKERVTRR